MRKWLAPILSSVAIAGALPASFCEKYIELLDACANVPTAKCIELSMIVEEEVYRAFKNGIFAKQISEDCVKACVFATQYVNEREYIFRRCLSW